MIRSFKHKGLELFFTNIWLNMQHTYDLWKLESSNPIEYNNIHQCIVAISW